MNGVVFPKYKVHLLESVRSLWLSHGTKYQMQDLPQVSGEYLPALINIHSLTLFDTRVEHIPEDGLTLAFQRLVEPSHTYPLRSSTLFNAFATLVDCFPNIRTLQLRPFMLEQGSLPLLSRPLRGNCTSTTTTFKPIAWNSSIGLPSLTWNTRS